jgi:hypothetical protein
MYDSNDQCRIPQRPRFEWEEQFYKALSGSPDLNEANAAAEWVVFTRLNGSESDPLSAEERSAMDDCLLVLRRFQVEQLNYPRLDLHVDEVNSPPEEEKLIEQTFEEIVGRPRLLRDQPYFLRKLRRA